MNLLKKLMEDGDDEAVIKLAKEHFIRKYEISKMYDANPFLIQESGYSVYPFSEFNGDDFELVISSCHPHKIFFYFVDYYRYREISFMEWENFDPDVYAEDRRICKEMLLKKQLHVCKSCVEKIEKELKYEK